MSMILRLYSRALHRHPWKTQIFTTGFLMASSDLISQTVFEGQNLRTVDLPRIARFAFLGTCFVAPSLKLWYLLLERTFGTVGKTVGLKKMLCDQCLFTPCFLVSFLVVFGVMQLQPWHAIKTKIKEDYFKILKTNYMLWPGAQLITFYLIPFQMRIVFVSFVALLWNTYLAYQANKKK